MNIYVEKLPFTAGEGDLRSLFAEFGAVAPASVVTDRDTGSSRGFSGSSVVSRTRPV